ncbi:MAG: GNAT family N-acetyltransferase [Demequina sp.]|uniref:GNAT family N-acetyltransferase n=1 Tax=Demequina sp. TaxID=2050685 RepID=UPI003A8BD80D
MSDYTTPVHITPNHDVESFRCSSGELTTWLTTHALGSHNGRHTRVAVTTPINSDTVVAYYAIAVGSVRASDADARLKQGGGSHPVPVVVLARLAVDERHSGRGLGGALLLDALRRALAASDQVGARAVVVHCKDDGAKAFYRSMIPGFREMPSEPMTLTLLMKDIKRHLMGA